MHLRRQAITLAAVLLLAACGGDDPTEGPAGDGSPTAAADPGAQETEAPEATETDEEMATGEGVTLDTASTDVGTILVDGEGMTLYLFDNDEGGESVCYDDCAETWPPLIGEAEASGEVDGALIGTTERDDGSLQVTYDGHPLYHFAPDEEPGDVQGQGVGGVWWVIGPDGSRITEEASAGRTVEY